MGVREAIYEGIPLAANSMQPAPQILTIWDHHNRP